MRYKFSNLLKNNCGTNEFNHGLKCVLAFLCLPTASTLRNRHEAERLCLLAHAQPAPITGRATTIPDEAEPTGCRAEAMPTLLLSLARAASHHRRQPRHFRRAAAQPLPTRRVRPAPPLPTTATPRPPRLPRRTDAHMSLRNQADAEGETRTARRDTTASGTCLYQAVPGSYA